MTPRSIYCTLVFCCLALAASVVGQTSEGPTSPVVPAVSEDTPIEQLKLLLKPMTQEELGEEAIVWRDRLKRKATEIAAYEVNLRKLADNAKAGVEQSDDAKKKDDYLLQLNRLREEQSVLLGKFDGVMDAFELKGGDVTEFRKYAAALGGITVDATDARATWIATSGWITSKEGGVKWLIYILQFSGIMVAFWFISRLLSGLVRKALSGRHVHLSGLLKRFINNMVRRVILLIGLLVALATVGVNVGALVALIGGGAFVLGFALQDTLSNFANGLMVLLYRPFDVGDAVDVGGVSGSVDAVSLVNTTIRSWDNKLILVPNKEVWGKVITNMTGSPERRVDMVFGIGYSDDSDKAKAILERLVKSHESILEAPAPTIRMHELADSSVNFVVRPWTKTSDYWGVYWDLTEQVKKAFDAEGISIPFPQRDVHLIPQPTESSESKPKTKGKVESAAVSDKGIDSDDEA